MAEPQFAAASGATGVRVSLTRTPSARSRFETAIRALLFACAALSVATTLAIVGSLLFETIDFFGDVGIGEYLLGMKWAPTFADPSFGVLPLIWGTVYVSLIALAVAVPLGL